MTAVDTRLAEPLDIPQQDVGQPICAPTPCSRIDGWIVVHAYAQAERWARDNLARRGYQTFLPMMTVRRRDRVVRSMWHSVSVPLFPRYLFVKYPGNWTPIRYCPGVYRIVSAAGKPNLASDRAVKAVQEAVEAAEASAALDYRTRGQWAPGTLCVVANGVFDNAPAVVLKAGKHMVLVSMMWFGHLREVLVQADSLRLREE